MISRFLIFLFFSFTLLFADKNVLVLHSYHHGLDWTDSISKGLIETTSKYPEKINLYFEYLDAKRNFGPSFLEQTYQYFSLKHAHSKYDVIIVSDNDALTFINHYGSELFSNVPVVFCGVNNFTTDMISNLPKVTGVKEIVDYDQTLMLARELFPQRKHVLIALDNTATAMKILAEFKSVEQAWHNKLEFHYLWDFDDKALQNFLIHYKDNFIVYILAYNRDKKGHFFSYEESVGHIQEIVGKNVPLFASWSFFMGKDVLGGALTSGFTQGNKAAELLMQILEGKETKTLPLLSNMSDESMVLDYAVMQKFSLKKPMNLKVQYINEPIDFVTRNKVALYVLAATVGFFTLLLALLIWRNRMRNKFYIEANNSLEHAVAVAVQESQKNEKLFRFMADSSPYLIWTADSEFTLTYINTKAKEYFNQEPEQLLGASKFNFLPPEYFDEIQKQLQKFTDDKKLESVEFDFYCEHYEKHFKNFIIPIILGDGELAGYKGIMRDITEEKAKIDTLRAEAQTDYLTGTLNRSSFDNELDALFRAFKLLKQSSCVMMLDVDFFKAINDTFGHFIGDYVLKKIAHSIKSQVRKSDYVFRYGGEEFAIVLPDITLEQSVVIAEKIRQVIGSQQFKVEEENLRVTISIGLSLFQDEDQSTNKVVIRADEALYRAKSSGRNRVEVNYDVSTTG